MPFLSVAFIGFPLSQTIYGMILRNAIKDANLPATGSNYLMQMIIGIVGGLAIGMSAYMQGKAAARACDSLTETGKGVTNYIIALGIIETVAIFVMVFCMTAIPKI